MLPSVAITSVFSPPARRLIVLAVSAALLLNGCSTAHLASTVDVPTQFSTTADTAEPAVSWWERYDDPELTRLITLAASNNRDVQMAEQRVRAARAGVTISRSAMLPNIGATAGAVDTGNGYKASQGVPELKGSGGGLSVAWELDLTGRLRAGANAAQANAQASAAQAQGVRLLVLTDVASNYFTLTGAQRQLDTVRAIANTQQETLRLVSARFTAGLASLFDVARARTEAAQANAAIPLLETMVAVSRHRLAVLIGLQPADAAVLMSAAKIHQVPDIKAGLPASLLQRRPDLLALHAQLEAANWQREQAAAEWFPRLFVNALFGRQSLDVGGVDLGAARFSNVAGLLSMPVFDWGRTSALNEAAESAQTEALLRYENGIVRALEDVENSLVAFKDERQREHTLQAATASAGTALQHAESLYQKGQIDLLPLLDAQRVNLAVQLNANDSQTRLLLNSVQLFKALGGGWQAFTPEAKPEKQIAATQNPKLNNEELP